MARPRSRMTACSGLRTSSHENEKRELPDCRGLVSRTPPEGLVEWAYSHDKTLHRAGLLYEAEWVSEMCLEALLSPEPRPKRVKMVRVTCSACGRSKLMEWVKDPKAGYGFRTGYEYAEGGLVFADGDEANCPQCGAVCLVRKRSSLGRRGYFVSAESRVMSASLAGEGNMLALTVWTVQNRVFQSGSERLVPVPEEAYIFSQDGCIQLKGWRTSYSRTCGYLISYSPEWRQPKRWTDSRLEVMAVFGLTEELLAQSSLPHCKLDVYMDRFQSLCKKYPVSYLRLYQEHPNVETLLLHGLPLVLHDLIREERFFQADGLLIRPAKSQKELADEGDALHHCVGSYAARHAGGKTAIFFLRRAAAPNEPYYTLELDEAKLVVRQNRGLRNCSRTKEVQAFEERWLEWVRAGCLRDEKGRPVLPETRRRAA